MCCGDSRSVVAAGTAGTGREVVASEIVLDPSADDELEPSQDDWRESLALGFTKGMNGIRSQVTIPDLLRRC